MNTPPPTRRLMIGALGMAIAASVVAPSPANAYFRHYNRGNLVEELRDDGRFSVLVSALEATGLDSAVADGRLTVFAPTDDAFARIDAEVLEELLAEPGLTTLTNILLYHVVEGRLSTNSLERRRTPQTLLGQVVITRRTDDGLFINDSQVIDRNNRATNGFYHAIDAVLLPAEEPVEVASILDVLRLDGRFSVLLSALEATGLDEAVATGKLTLFAPTDDAFAPLLEAGTIDELLAEPGLGTLTDILLYHVVEGRRSALSLLFFATATTLQGTDVRIEYSRKRGFRVNDSRVISANGRAPNGVIHIIDAVLIPEEQPSNLVELLEADGRFTVLLAALEATGLDDAVAGGGVTVFAPTDEAFAPLVEDGTVEALLNEPGLTTLTEILTYHVVPGEQTARDLVRARRVETLQGSDVRIRWFFGRVFINQERVVEANVRADNGIAHAINGVLMPPQ